MLIGYAPVSKADGSQVLDAQRDALAVAHLRGPGLGLLGRPARSR